MSVSFSQIVKETQTYTCYDKQTQLHIPARCFCRISLRCRHVGRMSLSCSQIVKATQTDACYDKQTQLDIPARYACHVLRAVVIQRVCLLLVLKS